MIIPTYNEALNLTSLLEEISESFSGDFEVLVVDDDSPDETWRLAEDLGGEYEFVEVVRRVGRRGLSSAVLEGFSHARGRYLAVMDADLSHPPDVIPRLYGKMMEGFDVAVASRYVAGGGVEDWPWLRRLVSRGAGFLARGLTEVSDPMSGCFMLDNKLVEDCRLNPMGFKILLEILVKADFDSVVEVPYVFRNRLKGESKLGSRVFMEYVGHLIGLYWYKLSR